MRMRLVTAFCMLSIVLVNQSPSARAQKVPAAPLTSAESSPKQLTPAPLRIAAGDLLNVSVFDTPELTQDTRVGANGTIDLALIGAIPVQGLTSQEAAESIGSKLRDGKFLLHPQVNVLIKEFASQGVSVVGEVQHPGVYPVLGPRTLLDVISLAGGLTNVADSRVTIKRRGGKQENITVKLKTDDAAASLAGDVQVYPGDLVVAPRAGIVYVLGDVSRPGGFVMQDSGSITVLQALAQAGGATKTASLDKAVLLRNVGNQRIPNKIQLSKISRGDEPDVQLRPNDVVFIPKSGFKSVFEQTQGVASSIGSASIYAIIR